MVLSTNKVLIYIRLLDEGTDVYRPTQGLMVDDMVFKVLPTEHYDPKDEYWEFPPGKIVRCKKELKNGHELLIAFEEY
jgi:hypothetical protein